MAPREPNDTLEKPKLYEAIDLVDGIASVSAADMKAAGDSATGVDRNGASPDGHEIAELSPANSLAGPASSSGFPPRDPFDSSRLDRSDGISRGLNEPAPVVADREANQADLAPSIIRIDAAADAGDPVVDPLANGGSGIKETVDVGDSAAEFVDAGDPAVDPVEDGVSGLDKTVEGEDGAGEAAGAADPLVDPLEDAVASIDDTVDVEDDAGEAGDASDPVADPLEDAVAGTDDTVDVEDDAVNPVVDPLEDDVAGIDEAVDVEDGAVETAGAGNPVVDPLEDDVAGIDEAADVEDGAVKTADAGDPVVDPLEDDVAGIDDTVDVEDDAVDTADAGNPVADPLEDDVAGIDEAVDVEDGAVETADAGDPVVDPLEDDVTGIDEAVDVEDGAVDTADAGNPVVDPLEDDVAGIDEAVDVEDGAVETADAGDPVVDPLEDDVTGLDEAVDVEDGAGEAVDVGHLVVDPLEDSGPGNDETAEVEDAGEAADASDPMVVALDALTITQDSTGTLTFLDEGAGFQNSLGFYKIADDGAIEDVQFLFPNASSNVDHRGDLVAGESSVDIALSAGDQIGFFIVPNGYEKNPQGTITEDGQYVFRDSAGELGNVNGTGGLFLYRADPETGEETAVVSEFGLDVYHSAASAENGFALNPDSFAHTIGTIDPETGEINLGFEDWRDGGDRSFTDVVFRLELGDETATVSDSNLIPEADDAVSSSADGDEATVDGTSSAGPQESIPVTDNASGELADETTTVLEEVVNAVASALSDPGGDAPAAVDETVTAVDDMSGVPLEGADVVPAIEDTPADAVAVIAPTDVIDTSTAAPSAFDEAYQANITVTFSGNDSWWRNSGGVYTVEPDGTITNVHLAVTDGRTTTPGETQTFAVSGSGETAETGAFMIVQGETWNDLSTMDLQAGQFEFVYDHGGPGERAGNTADSAANLTLVFKGADGDIAMKGDVYHADTALNGGTVAHVAAVSDDGATLYGFEDNPMQGDFDYNDIAFSVSVEMVESEAIDSAVSDSGATTTDASNESDAAVVGPIEAVAETSLADDAATSVEADEMVAPDEAIDAADQTSPASVVATSIDADEVVAADDVAVTEPVPVEEIDPAEVVIAVESSGTDAEVVADPAAADDAGDHPDVSNPTGPDAAPEADVAAASSAGFTFVSVNDWYNPNWGGGFNAYYSYEVQPGALVDDVVSAWEIAPNYDGPGEVKVAWTSNFSGATNYGPNAGDDFVLTTVGIDTQLDLSAGDKFIFGLQAKGAAFDESHFHFTFEDLDATEGAPSVAAENGPPSAAEIVDGTGFGIGEVNDYHDGYAGGFIVSVTYSVTSDDVEGGSVKAWDIAPNYTGEGDITRAWTTDLDAKAALGVNEAGTTVLSTVGQGYQASLEPGDSVSFNIQVDGAGYQEEDFDFAFQDRDGDEGALLTIGLGDNELSSSVDVEVSEKETLPQEADADVLALADRVEAELEAETAFAVAGKATATDPLLGGMVEEKADTELSTYDLDTEPNADELDIPSALDALDFGPTVIEHPFDYDDNELQLEVSFGG